MEMISNMRKVIKYFTYKYSGNWEDIYNAIKSKEQIHPLNLTENDEQKDKQLGYISIIDSNYPENYKEIYMPPLSLFVYGDNKLLNHKNIVSIWGKIDEQEIETFNNNSKDFVYAIKFDNNLDQIKYLNKKAVRLILIDGDKPTNKKIMFLKNLENICYLSEYPIDIQHISKSEEQTFERLLIGVSKYSIFFNNDNKNDLDKFEKIHNFESRDKYFYNVNKKIIKENTNAKIVKSIDEIVCIKN